MLDTVKTALVNQFHASLFTLGQCVAACPPDLWFERVGDDPYWYVAYHALYFADYYLSANDAAFRPRDFHREDEELLGPPPWPSAAPPGREVAYTPEVLGGYVGHCRHKATDSIAAETAASLAGPSGFPRRDVSRLEMHVYNVRHIQHHAAQLSLRLRWATGNGIDWRGTGWPDETHQS